MTEEIYKGYVIKGFEDGLFDIEEASGDLIDGNFNNLIDFNKVSDAII